MRTKKGILGSLVSIFVATILVIIILFGFVIFSGLVKTFGDVSGDTKVYEENETGIDDVGIYMESYKIVLEKRADDYEGRRNT